MLAREHQLQQRGVACGKADVRCGSRPQAILKVLARAFGCLTQLDPQAREARLGEGVEQRLAIGEVPARSAVADADLARELAQRELLDTALAHRPLRLREQSGA